MDLEALLRAARDGSPEAWDALIPQLYANLRPYFRSEFDESESIELAQRTATAVIQQLPGFVPQKSLTRWVFGIARNQARMELRARKRRQLLALVLAEEPGGTLGAGPASRIHARERAQILLEEIERLPSIYRRIVEHDLEGGDIDNLLEREDIRPGTARSRRYRAYHLLRERITARLSTPIRADDSSSPQL